MLSSAPISDFRLSVYFSTCVPAYTNCITLKTDYMSGLYNLTVRLSSLLTCDVLCPCYYYYYGDTIDMFWT